MSKYTTEVRFICEVEAGLKESKGFNSIDNILTAAAPKIFNFDFPIYDENYRLVLEKTILRHYYTREIGMETVGLWKLKLQDRLCIIMPYYNKLYESALLEFNPFHDVDLTIDHNKGNDGTSNSNSTGKRINSEDGRSSFNTNDSNNSTISDDGESHETHNDSRTGTDSNTRWDLYSDTPQGGIQGIANAEDPSLANNGYLTNARKITDNGGDSDTSSGARNLTSENDRTIIATGNKNGSNNSTLNQTINDTGTNATTIHNLETYIEHVKGKKGSLSYSKMLMDYRKSLINIDKMIIDELSDLFFGLWE